MKAVPHAGRPTRRESTQVLDTSEYSGDELLGALLEEIREGMKAIKWTQRDLSFVSGISEPHLSRIFRRHVDPTATTLLRLLTATGFSVIRTQEPGTPVLSPKTIKCRRLRARRMHDAELQIPDNPKITDENPLQRNKDSDA